MVQSLVLPRILDRQHVGHLFDDADRRMVALVVGADRADFLVGEVVALRAIFDLVAETGSMLSVISATDSRSIRRMWMGQAQRRTAPYAREFRQLADNVL